MNEINPNPMEARRKQKPPNDCEQLYFLIGAISDSLGKLPVATQRYFVELMAQKAQRTEREFRAVLQTFIEAIQP